MGRGRAKRKRPDITYRFVDTVGIDDSPCENPEKCCYWDYCRAYAADCNRFRVWTTQGRDIGEGARCPHV